MSPDNEKAFLEYLELKIAECQANEEKHLEPGKSYWEGRSDALDFAQQKFIELTLTSPT